MYNMKNNLNGLVVWIILAQVYSKDKGARYPTSYEPLATRKPTLPLPIDPALLQIDAIMPSSGNMQDI